MALKDYLNENSLSDGSNVVDSVNLDIEQANANAQKRAKAEELRRKIENLKAQRAQLVARRDSVKAENAKITDDELMRMAKVKGIKDEDINAYINARSSQRNADNERERMQMMKDQTSATAESNRLAAAQAKKEAVDKVENELYGLQTSLAKVSNRLVSVEGAEERNAEFEELQNQYEKAMQKYKELTDKEWDRREYTLKDVNGSADVGFVPSEEVLQTMTNEEKAEFEDPTATEQKKREIAAKVQTRIDNKAKGKGEVEKTRAGIIAEAKNKNLSEAYKSSLVTKYRNTFKEPKPTRDDVRKTLFGE